MRNLLRAVLQPGGWREMKGMCEGKTSARICLVPLVVDE
jgi:hypothetical protein